MKKNTNYKIYNTIVANMVNALIEVALDGEIDDSVCGVFCKELSRLDSSFLYGLMTSEEEVGAVYSLATCFMRADAWEDKFAVDSLSKNAMREAVRTAAKRFANNWVNLSNTEEDDELLEISYIDEPSFFDDLTIDIRNPDKPGKMRRMLRAGW